MEGPCKFAGTKFRLRKAHPRSRDPQAWEGLSKEKWAKNSEFSFLGGEPLDQRAIQLPIPPPRRKRYGCAAVEPPELYLCSRPTPRAIGFAKLEEAGLFPAILAGWLAIPIARATVMKSINYAAGGTYNTLAGMRAMLDPGYS